MTLTNYLHRFNGSRRVVVLIVGVILIVALSFTCRFNSNVYMYTSHYGNPILFVGNAVLGIAGVTCICFFIKKNRFLEFLGRNSLVILVTHFPVYQILSEIGKQLVGGYGTWSIALLTFVFTCATECVVVYIVNKWIPWMTGKIDVTGNK